MLSREGVDSGMQFKGPRPDKDSEFLEWRIRVLCALLDLSMFARKQLIVALVWLASLAVLFLIYPSFCEQSMKRIPYSFLLLAPFGLVSFSQWTLVAGVSYWAVRALGWDEAAIRKAANWGGIGAACVLMLHAAWVLFVTAKRGI
jgi:hypothetical protein